MVISSEEKRVLRYIQEGHNIMCELFDLTGWPGEKIGRVVEKLDENRYIERYALQGLDFWSFKLTPKGAATLPPLSTDDQALYQFGLCTRDIRMLEIVKKVGKTRATQLIADATSNPEERVDMAGSVVKLLRLGYLKESGFLKRIIEISPNGEKMLPV